MKKLSILGIAVSVFVFSGNAAWLGSSRTVGLDSTPKSLSGLTGLIESKEIVTGAVNGQLSAGAKSQLSDLPVGQLSLSKAVPVRWKDSVVGFTDGLETISAQVIDAKQFGVPESGTWAAGLVMVGVALASWNSRRKAA
jgi:hypothetical protein